MVNIMVVRILQFVLIHVRNDANCGVNHICIRILRFSHDLIWYNLLNFTSQLKWKTEVKFINLKKMVRIGMLSLEVMDDNNLKQFSLIIIST